MTTVSRRLFLAFGLVAPAAGLSACGGGRGAGGSSVTAASVTPTPATTSSTAPPPSAAPAPNWDLSRALYVVANGSSSFDLSATLPAGVTKGGTFSVDGSGTALPAGLTLSATGVLLAAVGAPAGNIAGVVFSYNEP